MRQHHRRLGTAALAVVTPLALIGVSASSPAASADPSSPSWQQYLRTPAADDIHPVRVVSTTGTVSNPQALTGGDGEATLTMAADGARPRIVLDYGQEVGGTPYYNVTSSAPASGGSSMTLHAGFSESQEYLFTGGVSTATAAASAGATNVTVGSVANFIVGDKVTIGTGQGAETATLTAVGRPSTSTTLTVASSGGATNIKVAGIGGLGVGDTLTVDTGSNADSSAISAVGTPAGSSTLTAAATAGATAITVRSAAAFTVGDDITIGTTTGTIASISGTTLTLTAALAADQASGAPVSTPGTGVTLQTPLAHSHSASAAVTSPGTGITFTPALSAPRDAGAAVTSTPGTATGDFPGANTSSDLTVTAPGNLSSSLQGGFRYEVIELDSPGTVKLTKAGITFGAYRATADKYQGHFESSSAALNQLYYDGAYTVQMNMIPTGTAGSTTPQLFDGAKRDRRIWSGDLLQENATIANTLGTNGYPFVKADLQYLIDNQTVDGQLASVGRFKTYSLSYSMDTALAVIQYYRYSADTAFVNSSLAALKKEMSYLASNRDSRGLIVTTSSNGRDWAFDDGAHAGVDTYYNVLYYRLLTEMSYLLGHLGDPVQAASYDDQAEALRTTINDVLYNPTTGAYKFLESQPDVIPQDANVAAVLWGVAPKDKVQSILEVVKTQLWRTNGSTPYTDNAGFRKVMSPYINGFETAARFENGQQSEAMDLVDRMWGNMSRSSQYNGTFWEELQYDGSLWMGGHDSLAHGWSTAPTSQSSEYILGGQPVSPGYKTWTVKPHTAGLTYAKGTIPTAFAAPLFIDWENDATADHFQIEVAAPNRTSGTVAVPADGKTKVTVDGQTVWDGTTGSAYGARQADGYVYLSGFVGDHTVVAEGIEPPRAPVKTAVSAGLTHAKQVAGKVPAKLRFKVAAAKTSKGAKAGVASVYIDGRRTRSYRVPIVVRSSKAVTVYRIPSSLKLGKHRIWVRFTSSDKKAFTSSTSRTLVLKVVKRR